MDNFYKVRDIDIGNVYLCEYLYWLLHCVSDERKKGHSILGDNYWSDSMRVTFGGLTLTFI